MDSKKLEILMTAADLGSFTKASEVVGYTQSGLTHMMDTLEREVGFPLLQRSHSGIKFGKCFFLGLDGFGRCSADEAALSRHRSDPSPHFQLPVGPLDGVGVDGQCRGQFPDAGQLIPGLQDAGGDLLTQTVHDLGVYWPGIPVIKMYHSASLRMKCTNCTNTVVAQESGFVKKKQRNGVCRSFVKEWI